MICLPLLIILMGQAWSDYQYQFNTKTVKIKVFYCLTNATQQMQVIINAVSTAVFTILALAFLWTEKWQNYKTLQKFEGATFVYLVLVTQRFGNYVLNLLH